ncbi:hypothetical protein BGW36DRAFT_367793 [Talaromyces proteolyticus]|uniref:Uncharacterized protein n=1 Tax=Talaromyces proteolyticus TaxID=1131652 RepID=A0AAD4L0Y6_9EURO|nr:uncharacterized protein BGW36DRAFT_367793 [Talaromyces proteolyticus]KAH8705558.1 hypothetical protein BGW36DRAFT_367793 [Talaromyces proteolyticus]
MNNQCRKAVNSAVLINCLRERLRVSFNPPFRHTFDLYSLSEDYTSWSHQAEQLGTAMVSVMRAYSNNNADSRIILICGNVETPSSLPPLTHATKQLILRPQMITELEPMIWAFCSKYFYNESHEGPDAVLKTLILQLCDKGFLASDDFNFTMPASDFKFAILLLRDMLSPDQEKLGNNADDTWIIIDYPSFFNIRPDWRRKMEDVLTMLAMAVRLNPGLRLVVTHPGRLDPNIHIALGPFRVFINTIVRHGNQHFWREFGFKIVSSDLRSNGYILHIIACFVSLFYSYSYSKSLFCAMPSAKSSIVEVIPSA